MAWDLCCRCLSREAGTETLGTSELAQLIVFWLEEGQVPSERRGAIYQGMQEDLFERGKRVETLSDEQAMMCNWVKQLVHRELDSAREECPASGVDVPVDLDVEFSMH